jgi:hypothetical protein
VPSRDLLTTLYDGDKPSLKIAGSNPLFGISCVPWKVAVRSEALLELAPSTIRIELLEQFGEGSSDHCQRLQRG